MISPATLHRRFRAQLGTTPPAWLTGERVALACRLIERESRVSRGASVVAGCPGRRFEVVARLSGLGTATSLRALMRRETGLSPQAYRRGFPAPG